MTTTHIVPEQVREDTTGDITIQEVIVPIIPAGDQTNHRMTAIRAIRLTVIRMIPTAVMPVR